MVDPLGRLMAQYQVQTKDKEHIIGVEIDWVMSDELENHLHDINQKWILNQKHGEWCIILKKLKMTCANMQKECSQLTSQFHFLS